MSSCCPHGPPVEKTVGIDADDAENSEVEPLVPMFGGEIAVLPQFVGTDPVVPVNGASTLIICSDRLWLGNLNNDLVRWHMTGRRWRLRKMSPPSPILHVIVTKNR